MKEISHKGHNELQFERCQQIDSHEFQELWYSLESMYECKIILFLREFVNFQIKSPVLQSELEELFEQENIFTMAFIEREMYYKMFMSCKTDHPKENIFLIELQANLKSHQLNLTLKTTNSKLLKEFSKKIRRLLSNSSLEEIKVGKTNI